MINRGGYLRFPPKVTGILSPRKIEQVTINDGGTEYEPGIYRDVLSMVMDLAVL